MDSNTKNRWQIRLAVLVVFVAGFIAGILATNIYRGRYWTASPERGGRFEQMLDRLNLTPDQRDQVTAIFDDARAQLADIRQQSEPKFREVRKQTDDRLQAVLTPEQWEQFQQMKSEFKQRRPRHRER